jgi:hypothetical protein
MDSFDNMLELLLADDSPLPVTNDEPYGLDAPEAPMMPPAAAPPSPPLPILESPEAPMMRPTAAPYGWPSPPLPILEAPMAFVTASAAAPPNLPLPLPHISPYAHADLCGVDLNQRANSNVGLGMSDWDDAFINDFIVNACR